LQIAGRDQPLERIARQRREHRHRSAPVGDLNALAMLNPPQQLARALP
jgi:hypothetical protein